MYAMMEMVLGIAMGTSLACGYVNQKGNITGWLNELAFAPFDYSSEAPVDAEWSGDRGTGVNYFSQDAVIRLAPKVGIELDPKDAPGTKLKTVQKLLEAGDKRPRGIFEASPHEVPEGPDLARKGHRDAELVAGREKARG